MILFEIKKKRYTRMCYLRLTNVQHSNSKNYFAKDIFSHSLFRYSRTIKIAQRPTYREELYLFLIYLVNIK